MQVWHTQTKYCFSVEKNYGTLTEWLCEWNKIPFIRIAASKEIMEGKDLTESNKNLEQHLHITQTHSISGPDFV